MQQPQHDTSLQILQSVHHPFYSTITIELPPYKHYFRILNPTVITNTIQNYNSKLRLQTNQPLPHYIKNQNPQYIGQQPHQPDIAYIHKEPHPIRAMKFRDATLTSHLINMQFFSPTITHENSTTTITSYSNVISSTIKTK